MASANAAGPDGFPGPIEYSTTDHVFRDDRDVSEFPRGWVDPPETPGGGNRSGKEPESVARPMDSEVMADPRGTRLSEQGHPAFPKAETKPKHWVRRIVVFAIVAAILGAVLYRGVPELLWILKTTSTD